MSGRPLVGVLALQGDVREHVGALDRLGVESRRLKRPGDLAGIDAVVLPGGESTTIGRLAERTGILAPLRELVAGGLPTLGTCAGLIFASRAVTEGTQPLLGILDVVVARNAFGRQNESFETDLPVTGLDRPFPAVFIRAPWVAEVGGGVEVLATVEGHPVMVRQGTVLGLSFHPELTDDLRIHTMLIDLLRST